MVTITFNDLIRKCGLPVEDVRLLRHHQPNAIKGRSVYELWHDDRAAFERYQAEQSATIRAKLAGTHWVAFIVTPRLETVFVGLFRASLRGANENPVRAETTGEMHAPGTRDMYDVRPDDSLSHYSERIVIDWGVGTRSWAQRADRQEKAILELRKQKFDYTTLG